MAIDRGVAGVDDLVDQLEAARITGLPLAELAAHVFPVWWRDGRAWFDRHQCEAVSLGRHRPGDPPGYWLSMAQAAATMGVSRQAVYKMPLPTATTAVGQRVVRA